MTNDPSPTAQNAPKFTLSRSLDVRDGSAHSRELSDSSTFVETPPSSRASTPDSAATLTASYRGADADQHWDEKTENGKAVGCPDDDILVVVGAAGRLPEEVYERTLSWWRAGIRRAILRNVEWESRVLAAMQSYVRHPILDAYFVYTSSLGTHTFFMIMLPLFYFFGAPQFGRGLLLMLSTGVYVSSFLKDLCCVPRPFAPPVTRLTIGNHHLEYGFPSTHSTNSVSIALFLYTLLQRAYFPASAIAKPAIDSVVSSANSTTHGVLLPSAEVVERVEGLISEKTYQFGIALLLFYVFSIVYGRLYTAMHSFTDCIVGVALGAGIWGLHILCGEYVDNWVHDNGFIVPAIIVPLCLYLVHRHPQPVDDCPCFEDAIAFVSVVMGEFVARWYMVHNGFDESFFARPMPGASWATWPDVATWWSTAAIKMVIGVLTIFVWRIVAKSFCHFVLPPTFRFLSHLFTLPHRRFYTPATDYTSVPPEKGLRPIPSVIDLPRMVEYEVDGGAGAAASSTARRELEGRPQIKNRRGAGGRQEMDEKVVAMSEKGASAARGRMEMEAEPSGKDVKHYDADVLTKVFVYCGIGIMSAGVIPVMFEILGWGVKTS